MLFVPSIVFGFALLGIVRGGDSEEPTPISAYHNRSENYVAPEDWATHWSMCGFPKQSPIDLSVTPTYLNFAKDDLPLILEFNSCQNMYDADVDELDTSPKWAFVDGDCYAYGQNKVPHGIFHSDIHTPAEHTLNGVQHDMEFHIGWQYQEPNATVPNVLVIGFIFQGTNDADEHPFLAKLIEIQNNNITENNPVDLGKNWPEMLGLRSNTSQHDVTFINYIGSGDVPPCLGGIDWWIVDTPIVVAQSQVDTIHGIVQTMFRTDDGNNARPIQSLDDREIRTGDAEDDDTSASFVQCIHMILTAALLNAWLLVY